jgi:hypothetical protein
MLAVHHGTLMYMRGKYMLRNSRGILLVPAILLLVICHSNPCATHPTEQAAGHVTRPTNTRPTNTGMPLD